MIRTANIVSLTTGTEVPQEATTHLPDMWQLCEDPQGCNSGLCDWHLPLPAVCVRGCFMCVRAAYYVRIKTGQLCQVC